MIIGLVWLFSFTEFPFISPEKVQGHCLKLHQGRFRLDIRRNFFTEKVVKHLHWNAQRAGRITISGVFKEILDMECSGLVDKVLFDHRLGSMISEAFSNLNASVKLKECCINHPDIISD